MFKYVFASLVFFLCVECCVYYFTYRWNTTASMTSGFSWIFKSSSKMNTYDLSMNASSRSNSGDIGRTLSDFSSFVPTNSSLASVKSTFPSPVLPRNHSGTVNAAWKTTEKPLNTTDPKNKESSSTNIILGTTLSSNTSTNEPLCPLVPPKLVGPLKVLTEAPPFEKLEKMFPALEPGGRFKPPDCVSSHRVAIIIPYRNREEHLKIFLHNMHPMLMRQQLDYGIFVVEQASPEKFNRAKLMNVGYAEATKLYDYQCFIFHDVDLIPEDDKNLYTCPEQPRHMSVAINTHNYRLPYTNIFGGISAMTKEHVILTNGFSNEFWGWGGEDDDMFNRIQLTKLKITRYSSKIARYTMLKHKKDVPNPKRYKVLKAGKARYKTDGLNSLKYKRLNFALKKLYTWILVDISPQ